MTAKEALKISESNWEKELYDVLHTIESASKIGKVKIIIYNELQGHTISKLMDLGYDYTFYSDYNTTQTKITWINGRDKRREDDY